MVDGDRLDLKITRCFKMTEGPLTLPGILPGRVRMPAGLLFQSCEGRKADCTMSIPIEDAVALALGCAPVLEEEEVPLAEALDRILSRQVCSAMAQPPFDRSPLDGYAVRSVDIAQAARQCPATLQVIEKLYAGQAAQAAVGPRQAVRLMTGAMIPQGADCVIRQEDTDLGETVVQIYAPVPSGGNFCRAGEEYAAGDVLLCPEQKVDAAAAAVAAGAGMTHLPVCRRARAAVITTGDEICQPGCPLAAGKIYDSNSAYLTARLRQLGVLITKTCAVDDTLGDIVSALESCGDCDLILTTGGVSVGQKDLLEAAVCAFGAEVVFHGIAIKPGMPTLLAKRGKTLILGLSGNPFSAAVPFELLLRPVLAKMTRDPDLVPRERWGTAANRFPKPSPVRRFLRARCDGGTVSMPTAQSNGQMRSMIGCNCLVDIPAGSGVIRPGDRVRLHLL